MSMYGSFTGRVMAMMLLAELASGGFPEVGRGGSSPVSAGNPEQAPIEGAPGSRGPERKKRQKQARAKTRSRRKKRGY